MNEQELERKFKDYQIKNERLTNAIVKLKAKNATSLASFLFVLQFPVELAVIVIGAMSLYSSVGGEGGSVASTMLSVFGALGWIAWTALGIIYWFTDGYNRSSWKSNYEDSAIEKERLALEKSELLAESKERKEFMKLYEALRDPDFRREYFSMYVSREDKFAAELLKK